MVQRRRLALILLIALSFFGSLKAEETDAEPESFPISEEAEMAADSLYVEEFHPMPEIEKEDLYSWIEQDRRRQDYHRPFFIKADKMAMTYRFGSRSTLLDYEPAVLMLHGFQKDGSLVNSGLFLDYFSRYHSAEYRLGTLDFGRQHYLLPLAVSGLKAGLGEYRNQELGAFLKRRALFGVPALGIDLDYSLQNGYWLDLSANGSSYLSALSYLTEDLGWEMEYAGYQKEGSNQELITSLYTNQVYSISHDYKYFYGRFYYRWLDFSLLKSAEKTASYRWNDTYKNRNLQMAVGSHFNPAGQDLALRYEYQRLKRNYRYVESRQNEDFRHKTSLRLSGESFINHEFELENQDFKRSYSRLGFEKNLGLFGLGLYDTRRYQNPVKDDGFTDPADPAGIEQISLLQNFLPAESAIYTRSGIQDLNATVALGFQKLWQNSSQREREENQFFCRISAEYNPRFGDWELRLFPAWKYQDNSIKLMENPRFSFSSVQSISRHLGHDNRLDLGLKILGHSAYYLANPTQPVLIEASTSLDAWLLLKIGRLFDISVEAQNIMNTSIFGLFPLPGSIHARVHWYFIN